MAEEVELRVEEGWRRLARLHAVLTRRRRQCQVGLEAFELRREVAQLRSDGKAHSTREGAQHLRREIVQLPAFRP